MVCITQSLFQDIETINRMNDEDALSTKDLARKESLKLKLANRLQIKEIS